MPSRPEKLVSGVPEDEQEAVEMVETINFSDINFSEQDFTIWDAYPWLTPAGFRFVLLAVLKASREQQAIDGLTIEGILDDCAGSGVHTRDRDSWASPFGERWGQLSETDLDEVEAWLAWLSGCTDSREDGALLEECRKTLSWLRHKESSVIRL